MTEPHKSLHLPWAPFVRRMLNSLFVLQLLVVTSLAVGMVGYHFAEGMSWLDAFYNAALILSGMGPAMPMQTDGGKIFASLYALYSGLVLIAATGLLLTPVFHRALHRFHMEQK